MAYDILELDFEPVIEAESFYESEKALYLLMPAEYREAKRLLASGEISHERFVKIVETFNEFYGLLQTDLKG